MLKVHLIMPTAIECLCCSEITEMMNKRSTEEVGCITLHPGFQSVCLNTWFSKPHIIAIDSSMVKMLLKELFKQTL